MLALPNESLLDMSLSNEAFLKEDSSRGDSSKEKLLQRGLFIMRLPNETLPMKTIYLLIHIGNNPSTIKLICPTSSDFTR